MTPESVTDLKSLVFVVGSLLSVAAAVRFRPSECRLVAEAALPVGLIGFLIGVISMLAAESKPSQIAPDVAIAILTLVSCDYFLWTRSNRICLRRDRCWARPLAQVVW